MRFWFPLPLAKLPQAVFEFGEPRTLSVKGIEDTIVAYPLLGLRDDHV